MSTMTAQMPATIAGITRPCATCDTTNLHFEYDDHAYRPARIFGASAAWTAVREQARAIGWPRSFTSDLYRDWQSIAGRGRLWAGRPAERFLWGVRDSGTALVRLEWPEIPQPTTAGANATCPCGWFYQAYGAYGAAQAADLHAADHRARARGSSPAAQVHANRAAFGDSTRWFYWNGRKLHEVSAEQAYDIAATICESATI